MVVVKPITWLNIDSAAQITKVTENTYVYPQVAFTAEDLYAEVLGRKCQAAIITLISPILYNTFFASLRLYI